ncbi:MAG: agglutinin biogenesis protein MshP [Sideroxydans sp.]|nr:agglutinin biogenesis protein MshP [Sideroxydans sp.]
MKKIQHGFSIITAIFLLVVLGFLGVAMVSFSTSQHESSAMDVMGVRAYQAARAGIEWGAYQVLPNSAAAFATACRLGAHSNTLPANTLGGTLNGFSVVVTCQSPPPYSDLSAASGVVRVYDLTATANQGVVERQIRVSIAQ